MRWSVEFAVNMFSRICFFSEIGMLEYILVMSREANTEVGVIGVCFSSWISSVVFLMLKVYGREGELPYL
jgi:hypothetical protein